jgi:hypothetical protein
MAWEQHLQKRLLKTDVAAITHRAEIVALPRKYSLLQFW